MTTDNIFVILNIILPVVLMLFIGMMTRRSGLLSREGIDALKSVVVNITLPAVMLHAFASMEWSPANVLIALIMFAVCVAAWLLGRPFAWKSVFLPYLTTGFEAGMLGYSLFMLLYGAENISSFAGVDLGQVLFVFTLYKLLLGREFHQQVSIKQLVREMVQSPTVIAILAGVLIGASGLYRIMTPIGISGLMDTCTDFISAPTSAIILITVGYDLQFRGIRWSRVGRVIGVRIAIMALLRLITGFALRACGMGDSLDAALNIMFILPAPYVLPVFADDEEERSFVSSTLSVMTLASILAFFILCIF